MNETFLCDTSHTHRSIGNRRGICATGCSINPDSIKQEERSRGGNGCPVGNFLFLNV